MKVLLISPPIQDFFFTPKRAYPLGVLYLASPLKAAGWKVKILNCPAVRDKNTLSIPGEFRYLTRYYNINKSPFCLFSHYRHFGMSFEEISRNIKEFMPDVVGISANFSPYFNTALEIAKLVKDVDSRIVTVMGGRFPTAMPAFVLKNKEVDFVIRGEAEYAFFNLCLGILKGRFSHFNGLCYKTKNKSVISRRPVVIDDLNNLPFPRRDLVNQADYAFAGEPSVSILASRGCIRGCDFCAISEKFRFRSAGNVFKEVEECFRLGVRHFNFEDDNINLSPEFKPLINMLISTFGGRIKISFMNGVSPDNLGFNLRRRLIEAGLTHLDFSIAAFGSEPRLRRRVFYLASKFSKAIACTIHFIIGKPKDSFSACLRNIKALARLPVYLGPSIFYPVIESPGFGVIKEKFGIKESDYHFFRSSAAHFDKTLSRDEIFSLFYFCRIVNFIKGLIDENTITTTAEFFNFLDENDKETAGLCYAGRRELGVFLLKKVLKEHKLARVDGVGVINEDFVSPLFIKRFLRGLEVCGLSGNTVFFNSCMPQAARLRIQEETNAIRF